MLVYAVRSFACSRVRVCCCEHCARLYVHASVCSLVCVRTCCCPRLRPTRLCSSGTAPRRVIGFVGSPMAGSGRVSQYDRDPVPNGYALPHSCTAHAGTPGIDGNQGSAGDNGDRGDPGLPGVWPPLRPASRGRATPLPGCHLQAYSHVQATGNLSPCPHRLPRRAQPITPPRMCIPTAISFRCEALLASGFSSRCTTNLWW